MQELKFSQFKDAYRYNIDSYLLFGFCEGVFAKRAFVRGARVMDVGCGCGFVGILLKFIQPKIELILLDISPKMCDLARLNLQQNKIHAELINTDFREILNENLKNNEIHAELVNADFGRILGENLNIQLDCQDKKSPSTQSFAAKNDGTAVNLSKNVREKLDFIISNPPFYRKDALNSPNELLKLAKSSDSLDLESFIKTSAKILKPKGALIFCYEAGAIARICALLNAYKFTLTRLKFVYKDENSRARLVLIEARRNSKSPCIVESPLFVYEKGALSAAMSQIYARVKVQSIDI